MGKRAQGVVGFEGGGRTPEEARRSGSGTRAAIIECAGVQFAARGFSGVTAREVATAAGVALSAIPYHFGSMEDLYREVLLRACEVSPEAVPLKARALAAPPAEGLRLAIRWAVADFAAMEVAWPVRLIEREEADPSAAFREVMERKVVPEWEWLCRVVGRATGADPGSARVKFGVMLMYTMTSSLMTRRGMLERLAPEVQEAVEARERYVEMMAELTVDAVSRFGGAFGEGVGARPARAPGGVMGTRAAGEDGR
jgi:TetR/AcrR family transcriptional regulator, regulator of cefoperazone and chloramphenicol sensitivity